MLAKLCTVSGERIDLDKPRLETVIYTGTVSGEFRALSLNTFMKKRNKSQLTEQTSLILDTLTTESINAIFGALYDCTIFNWTYLGIHDLCHHSYLAVPAPSLNKVSLNYNSY